MQKNLTFAQITCREAISSTFRTQFKARTSQSLCSHADCCQSFKEGQAVLHHMYGDSSVPDPDEELGFTAWLLKGVLPVSICESESVLAAGTA